MIDSAGGGLFSFQQRANYWNDLYERPASLFEHHMLLRRDYATNYICWHFDAGTRLLDLGCGAGVLSEKLLERGFKVTAADASPDMLALARQRLHRFPRESCQLQQANCLDLPFADGEFDLVVCLGVFGYFDEVTRALNEIRRVLRPGGTLIISVRNAHTQHVFDLLQVMKHPFRLVRGLYRRVFGQPPAPPFKPKTADDDGFRVDIYQPPMALMEGVCQRGYSLLKFDGLGYGPVTFAEKKLFSMPFSIRLSDRLNRFFAKPGWNWIGRWFADVSFYVFRRNEDAAPSGSS